MSGDVSGLVELGQLFLTTAEELVARLRIAAAKGDLEALQAAGHSLKGSAVNLGARKLGRLAADLEKRAKAGDVPNAPEIVGQLAVELAQVRAELTALTHAGSI
jgi:HPt (histidine-containing phosphotransfer) domain-containing protein